MIIEFDDNIRVDEYLELRKKVKWCEFPPKQAEIGLLNSYWKQCVRYNGKAIGFARLLWDGGYIALLSDVMVDPEYQGLGIGTKLVSNSIKTIKDDLQPGYRVCYMVMVAKGKRPFYEKFGFVIKPNDNLGGAMEQWIE